MSYLIIKEDFNSFAYNILTRGLTIGLDSDFIRSHYPIMHTDQITYNEFGFLNDYGCFLQMQEDSLDYLILNQASTIKVFKYIVKISNKDDRVVWVYRKFFNSRNNMNMIYKVINKTSPKFGKGLMNTTNHRLSYRKCT